MTEQVNDVTQVETTTEASSAENQTTETTQETSQDDSSDTSKTVPYERFAEVNSIKKQLQAEIDQLKAQVKSSVPAPQADPQRETIKQQLDPILKEMGYVSKAELEQQDADRKLDGEINKLADKYNGKDGRPKFERSKVLDYASKNLIGNLEVAYKAMNEASLMDWAIKQASGKTAGVKTEGSDGSGASTGVANSDLLNAAKRGDDDALSALIKRTL
jgi:hypothetical protein